MKKNGRTEEHSTEIVFCNRLWMKRIGCISPNLYVKYGISAKRYYPNLIRMLGEDFHSVVLRMAVHIERIAMILSALRGISPLTAQRDSAESLFCSALRGISPLTAQRDSAESLLCSDTDYATAELIGRKPSSSPSFLLNLSPKPSLLRHNLKEYPVLRSFAGMTNGKTMVLSKKSNMEYIKKSHETVEILETLWANCLNCLKNLMQIFLCLFRPDGIRTPPNL